MLALAHDLHANPVTLQHLIQALASSLNGANTALSNCNSVTLWLVSLAPSPA